MQLRTLGDVKKEDKEKKGTTKSYAGGQKSGLAVENPDIASLMEKASLNSKTEAEFNEEKKKGDKVVVKITLYRNGYRIDDGDFHSYEAQDSKKFISELNQGYVPKELRAKYPKGGLTVSLSDHTEQQYVPPPPPPYVAFSGQGTSLGGPATAKTQVTASKPKVDAKFSVNDKKPKTSIQIRYHSGQKQTIEVNLDTRIEEIASFVKKATGVSKFDLVSGFPPAALALNKTVSELGLEDSTVIQRV